MLKINFVPYFVIIEKQKYKFFTMNETTTKPAPTAPIFNLGTITHDFNFKALVMPGLILMAAWFGMSVILILIKGAAYK